MILAGGGVADEYIINNNHAAMQDTLQKIQVAYHVHQRHRKRLSAIFNLHGKRGSIPQNGKVLIRGGDADECSKMHKLWVVFAAQFLHMLRRIQRSVRI